jgi:cytochrome c biogenesis protein CcmG/thiol:disulfide interchange protein DsbE
MNLRLVPLLIFALFASIAAVLLLREKPVAVHTESYTLPTLKLSALNDKKRAFAVEDGTMLLNFFASWCAPCLEEHQSLVALKKAFPNVRFHGVVWNDTPNAIRDMLLEHGNPYDALWIDDAGQAAIALGLRGIPETFVVKQGRVIYHISGPITDARRLKNLEAVLAQ